MNLSELILLHKGDRSYDQLAEACGGVPTSQRLQQMATTGLGTRFPTTQTIRNLAGGLGITERTVLLAVAESLGLDVVRGEPMLLQFLPRAAEDLTEDQALAIARLITAFRGEERAGAGDEATPIVRAPSRRRVPDGSRATPAKRAARKPTRKPPPDHAE